MPRPLLLDRPSGPYIRFLVPTDLRARVGSRFLVRPLRQAQGEAARLAAALLNMALSDAFRRMRRGDVTVEPWLARQQDKQAKLHQAVTGLASLGPTLVPQLLAVATDEQRPWVAAAAENISIRSADTAVEPNPETLPLTVLAESGRGGLSVMRPRPSL